jgi:SagB-type dehydrogenase family enzyme
LPVSQGDLSFVLQAAHGNLALQRAVGVELDLVIHAVAGVEPGVYRYQPVPHQLVAIRKGELRKEMVAACLKQTKAGSAAIGFVMAARLDAARSSLGDRRYRDLLIECGAIGQRIYLSAEAIGLAARNLAAYRDDRFNELLGLESRGMAALHLTMLGHGD